MQINTERPLTKGVLNVNNSRFFSFLNFIYLPSLIHLFVHSIRVKIKRIILLLLFATAINLNTSHGQIFQGGGGVKGTIAATDMCEGKDPVPHNASLNLREKKADSCKGEVGEKCRVNFDGETTEWKGPDTAIRTLDLSCYYTNADYASQDKCGSKTEFSAINYSSLLIFPPFSKPLWNVTIDISYSGEHFLNENVFVRVEVANDSNDSKSITSLILPCDDQNAFSGDSPGEILDMPAGNYYLKISQPDYAALNDQASPLKHKEGKIFIKYKLMITGHN